MVGGELLLGGAHPVVFPVVFLLFCAFCLLYSDGMPHICTQCSRVNPPEASYCYYDGAVLAGSSARGPINPGSQHFPHPFHFPNGQACRNFDQLATACQQNWETAVTLMKQGFFTAFLGGLGRADLALAAQDAARFPDPDRGFDQLLSRLPTQVLQPPRLSVAPTTLNLGVVPIGTDRSFDLHLSNLGMRLLYGSVASDCKWLMLGDAPGHPQKLFQFGAEAVLPVHVRGQNLRAGTKPLQGSLLIESNGGTATVNVRVEVPITPFGEGVLAGAQTPRQVAEKAKASPLDAAPLFEKGAVGQWFAKNGWTYPVQGPAASGLSAVQQFFEALGLARAPKVEVTTPALALEGEVGQTLRTSIELKSAEKKPVFANATADQLWLDVSRVKLNGRFATIKVVIPGVPNRPGEILQATIFVTGNGNQRFHVPLTLSVRGSPWSNLAPAHAVTPLPGTVEASVEAMPIYQEAIAVPAFPVGPAAGAIPAYAIPIPPPAIPPAYYTTPAPPPPPAEFATFSPAQFAATPRAPDASNGFWLHLIPLGILFLGILAVLLRDILAR